MNDLKAIQLRKALEAGISLEDACESLELDVDGAKAYLFSQDEKTISAEDFVKENKLVALKALMVIGLDATCDNVNARVSALKIIATGEGVMPDLPIDKYSETYKKMKEVTARLYGNKNSSETTTVTTPSPSTTKVDIKIENNSKDAKIFDKVA